jgi:glucosylceramidase
MFGHPEKTKDDMSVNFRMIRIPAGTSDFALSDYTYDDSWNDYDLKQFSIDNDRKWIIPVVKDVLTVNPTAVVMMTPWSAPAWMKDSNSIKHGSLRGDMYDTYSNYIVKFLQAYQDEGINVTYFALQNEPMFEPWGYAGMKMTPDNQKGLTKTLVPKLRSNGLSHIKVLAFDHNWGDAWFPTQVMQDNDARDLLAGSSFHCYGGNPEQQWEVINVAPEKEVHMTECNGMTFWDYGFSACVTDNIKWYLRSTRAKARSIHMWNYVLDWGSGPKNGGCQVCGGLVTVDEGQLPNVWYSSFYYGMGHFSKFMTKGTRLASVDISDNGGCIDALAFKNGDGSTHIGMVNSCDDKTVQIRWQGKVLEYTIQKGAMTFAWNLPSQITTTGLATTQAMTTGAEATSPFPVPDPLPPVTDPSGSNSTDTNSTSTEPTVTGSDNFGNSTQNDQGDNIYGASDEVASSADFLLLSCTVIVSSLVFVSMLML